MLAVPCCRTGGNWHLHRVMVRKLWAMLPSQLDPSFPAEKPDTAQVFPFCPEGMMSPGLAAVQPSEIPFRGGCRSFTATQLLRP